MGEIRNCKFSFKCPKEWASLKPTDQPDQRYCNECNQIVYFCKTGKQLMAAIKEDRCVAVAVGGASNADMVLGLPESIYDNNG